MTTLFLVRHAVHDRLGRVLCGRIAGVRLGEAGRNQSAGLAERLSREAIVAVYSSPLARAQETAGPIAERLGVEAEVLDGLTDTNFGEWSGLTFETLDRDERWAAWNRARGTARPPGGETVLDVQARAVGEIEKVVQKHPESAVAVVAHADPIKTVLAYYLGVGVDGITRFEISPASVSTLAVESWGAVIHCLNEVVAP